LEVFKKIKLKLLFYKVYLVIGKDRVTIGFIRIQNVESDEINQIHYLNSYKLTKENKKNNPKIKSIQIKSNALLTIYHRETLMKI
jgi:hypothetical protein